MDARPSTARPEEFDEFDTHRYDDGGSQNDRAVAAIAHFSSFVGAGLLAPIVIYFLKRDESEYVAHHAREAINFHLTVILAIVVSIPLMVVFGLGILAMVVVALGSLVLGVVAGVRALDGNWYEYPASIRFLS